MKRWVAVLVTLISCDCEQPARDCMPPPLEPSWRSIPLVDQDGMPQPRFAPAVAALGLELVIAGGLQTGVTEGLAITDRVLAFHTQTGGWRELPRLPIRSTDSALVGVSGRLLLLGGLDSPTTASGRAFVLEVNSAAWRELPAMPAPRGAAAVISAPPFIYLLGGLDGSGPRSDVIAFDIVHEQWVADAVAGLPSPRSHAAAMEQLDGALVIAGGSSSTGALADGYRLRPQGAQWSLLAPLSGPRSGCVYGVAFGSLLCAGGDDGGQALTITERFDPSDMTAGAWSAVTAMPEPRSGARGAMIGGQLYVVGGSRSLAVEPTDTIWKFDFAATIP